MSGIRNHRGIPQEVPGLSEVAYCTLETTSAISLALLHSQPNDFHIAVEKGPLDANDDGTESQK